MAGENLTLSLGDLLKTQTKTPTVNLMVPAETQPVLLERSPCNWDIKRQQDGSIVARSRLGNTFAGTMVEFNELLRS